MERHGALVGWGHHDMGNRVMLKLQSFHSLEDKEQDGEPDQFRFIMSKQQAAVLGNYLMEISGQTAATQGQRSLFRRLFG